MSATIHTPETAAPQKGARDLFNLDELAERAGVTRRFLAMEAERGRLRVLRLSHNVVRVSARDWQNYLNGCASTPAA